MWLICTKKQLCRLGIFALCGVLLGGGLLFPKTAFRAVFQPNHAVNSPCICIDAGHGGEDGGAVASSGAKESNINLAIAQKTEAIFHFLGYETQMTREEDISIHDASAKTIHEKKVSDLKNRVAQINGAPHAVLLSIHQNALPNSPATHGAQAFYNQVDGSRQLAEQIQLHLNTAINVNRPKEAKAIPESIYLMKKVEKPSVLVECGFLTNVAESEQLLQPQHQLLLSVAMTAGLLEGLNDGEHEGEIL